MKPDLTNALISAPALLGWLLIRNSPEGLTAGYIVEAEAYSSDDAASHCYHGQTTRTKIMFGPAGHLYVYFTYGMHHCINVVTGPKGNGQAVLIRALEPHVGIDIMSLRRHKNQLQDLTNGPAKLAQALGLSLSQNGINLFNKGEVQLAPGITPKHITQTTRIGISQAKEKPWRFYITDNAYVSKR